MRMIILILLASVFGYAVLQIDKIDPDNYVKMYLGNYVVEVKVLGFLLLLIAIVALLYFTLWLVRWIWRSPKTFGAWRNRRNRNLADEQFGAGYLSLIKGDWQRAEKQLVSKSDHSHVPYVNYLAAARAAQEQGRLEQRDEYLKEAYQAAPSERLAIGLTKARLHQKAGQIELARATLEDVQELGKSNPQYTAMLIQTFEESQDWDGIQNLLPIAKKQKALPLELLEDLQNSSYLHNLSGASDIESAWKTLPRTQRKRAKNIAVYAQGLMTKGDHSGAEKLIRSSLNGDWSADLADLYGQLKADKPEKLLRRIEGWLLARPEDPVANLAAGRLAVAANSLEVAKQYLQAAITNGPIASAYSELGELLETNNESAKALEMYRVGMQLLGSDQQISKAPKDTLLSDQNSKLGSS
jgi:HemY protein